MKNQKKLLLFLGLAAIFSLMAAAFFILILSARVDREFERHIAVKFGDTLSGILSSDALSGADINEIATLLRKSAGVKKLKANFDTIKIVRRAGFGSVDKVVLDSGPWRRIEFARTDAGWTCNEIEIEKETRLVLKSGNISDGDSFYAAGVRANIPEGVLMDAYDLLAFEMDFERDMRAGQQFQILYEENFAENKMINTGAIIALKFDAGKRGMIKMYRFVKQNGRPGYYDENGGGAIKSLKRTPINNARVTSTFGGNRRHPILGFTRAHRGVDFRAPAGTPIPSAGAGRIVKRDQNAGYGNFIRVRHNASYETLYAHLSGFQSGVHVGTQVRQGQTLGYVGSTGVSTGPHLHYEIIRDGRHVNPMTVKLPAIDNLAGDDKAGFLDLRPKIDESMNLMKKFPDLAVYTAG
ncbi:MAG: M23 family metallopeptidase [Rickettsiales bacterium]|nr:M23 family metallopeptidase [Rickettsiales bacterium]